MKTLILCRHAKADYPADTLDFDRPLKERGKKDATQLGKLLESQGFMPDLIVSSPANRALTTAKIVAKEIGYTQEIVENPKIYSASVGELVDIIQALPKTAETVMIFGHNDTMSETVRFLLQMQSFFEMPTCAMACLENSFSDWQFTRRYAARLRWVLVPRWVRKMEE
ncbi:MAG: SixA phosphatase family protein [Bacteroidia bacterium]